MGEITINIINGTPTYHVELKPPLDVSWDFNSAGVKVLEPVPEGSYKVKITDSNGCTVTSKGDVVIEGTTTTTAELETTTTTTIDPAFIFKVDVPESQSVTLPLESGYDYNFTVDWGDGSPLGTVTAYDDADATHQYTNADEYEITILGTCQCFNNGDTYYEGINQFITEVVQWGNCGFLIINFCNSPNLTTLPTGSITGAENCTTMDYGFYYCVLLDSIPAGLFDEMPNITSFYSTFYCLDIGSITSIPSGLFDNNILVTSFESTFEHQLITSIPSGLFDNNTLVEYFSDTFYGCPITSIPSGLFDNNTLAKDFSSTFGNTNITSIPSGLFDNNTLVEDFSDTFGNTKITSIPSELFTYNINVTTFQGCFSQCKQLLAIPLTLFDTNTLVEYYDNCFAQNAPGDSSLTGDAPELWNTSASGDCCFQYCSGLDNFCDAPYSWRCGGSDPC